MPRAPHIINAKGPHYHKLITINTTTIIFITAVVVVVTTILYATALVTSSKPKATLLLPFTVPSAHTRSMP